MMSSEISFEAETATTPLSLDIHGEYLKIETAMDIDREYLKIETAMYPAHYLEDEDTLMGNESDGTDVSFESNDSTLIDEDLEPPFINIYATDEDLRCEIQKTRNWMDAHSLIRFNDARKNLDLLEANNELGDARLRIEFSRKYTIWTGRLYKEKRKDEPTYRFRGDGFKVTYKNNDAKKLKQIADEEACHGCKSSFKDSTPFEATNGKLYCDEKCFADYQIGYAESNKQKSALIEELRACGKCTGDRWQLCPEKNDAIPGKLLCDICRMAQATYTTTWNGSPRQLSSLKKGYETRKGRPSLTKSLQSLAIDNHRIMKARLPQQTHKSIMSESFIIMDTEMIHGVGHWAREWSHVRHVFCIRFHLGKVTELNWDHDYITNHSMQALRDEFRNFCMDIDYIWFYARSRCDQIRIVDYLFEGGAVNANMEWMDAQVLIAMKMFSTDPLNPLPYVQSMSLASVDEAFIFQEEEPMFVEIDVGIPEQEREKVHKDVVNLGNLLNLARFVITE